MRILAIDPGYDRLGVAIIEKLPKQKETVIFSTCIQTDRAYPHQGRLATIANEVRDIIKTWEPEAMAIESLFLATNQKTAMKVAEVRGALLVEATRAALVAYEYTPLQIKVAVTGYGKSDKKQVTEMVKKLVVIPELPQRRLDDEYDAIAIGLTCLASVKPIN